jgi:hypothetical protein
VGKFKIEYTKTKTYTTTPVTGVIGGVSPTGLVQCELYAEKANVTNDHEIEISASGVPLSQKMQVKAFTRELQTSILITPEVARNIGQWLIKTSEEAEKASSMRAK